MTDWHVSGKQWQWDHWTRRILIWESLLKVRRYLWRYAEEVQLTLNLLRFFFKPYPTPDPEPVRFRNQLPEMARKWTQWHEPMYFKYWFHSLPATRKMINRSSQWLVVSWYFSLQKSFMESSYTLIKPTNRHGKIQLLEWHLPEKN